MRQVFGDLVSGKDQEWDPIGSQGRFGPHLRPFKRSEGVVASASERDGESALSPFPLRRHKDVIVLPRPFPPRLTQKIPAHEISFHVEQEFLASTMVKRG